MPGRRLSRLRLTVTVLLLVMVTLTFRLDAAIRRGAQLHVPVAIAVDTFAVDVQVSEEVKFEIVRTASSG